MVIESHLKFSPTPVHMFRSSRSTLAMPQATPTPFLDIQISESIGLKFYSLERAA